jgi:hypothetical protein
MEDGGWRIEDRGSRIEDGTGLSGIVKSVQGAGTNDVSPGMPCMLTLTEIEEAVDRLTADEKRELHRYLLETLHNGRSAEPGATSKKQRVNLPLVPSAHPGSRPLTAERVAELLSDDDVSH